MSSKSLAVAGAVEVKPTAFQNRVLLVPEGHDLFLGGGRGGGKSYALALLALRYCEQYGERARVVYLRQSYPGVADFELLTRELFARVYGTAARFNAQAHVWRLPGGGYLELNQLEGWADYAKFQGRSFGLLLLDEAGQWPEPALLDLLRSNLRGPSGQPVRVVIAANPGGVGHQWLAQRYVFRAAPWEAFVEEKTGRTWVSAPSTFEDNEFLDRAAYRGQLEAATVTDPELRRAWIVGDWAVARGAFFGAVLSEQRSAFGPWDAKGWKTFVAKQPQVPDWRSRGSTMPWRPELYLAHDFGSSAPSVTFVVWQSDGRAGPDGHFYPPESVVLLDELATCEPGSLTRGLGWTVPRLAEEIKALASAWGCEPRGVADDSIFAKVRGVDAASIADEFGAEGVRFKPAKKGDRRTGWERLRVLMSNAGKPDLPGFYASRACLYLWETAPTLPRDPRRPDDVDSRAPDHAADAARYAVLHNPGPMAGVALMPF